MNRFYFVLTFLFFAFSSFAQQLSNFTQYRENMTTFNPAAVGSNYLGYGQNLTFGGTYRAQWVGLDNAPVTAVVRGDYLNTEGRGVSLLAGGYLMHDETGPTGFTGLYGRIGGVISDDPYFGGIALGLSFGMVQYRVDVSEIRLRDPGDILGSENQSQFYPDVGFGIFAYQQMEGGALDGDYIYGGVSVPQLIGLDLSFKNPDGEFSVKRKPHFYGMLGMYHFLRNDGFIEPSVLLKYVQNAPVNVDFNLRYQTPTNFWIGFGGSSAGAIHGEAGFIIGDSSFGNNLKIGYGYDYSFRSFGPAAGATHEINISYSLER